MSDGPKAAPGVVSVALFRGINVGGRNRLPMKELVSELEALGLSDVGTYIQSGNAVFRGGAESPAGLSDRIAAAVEASHGFRPRVIVLTLEELRAAAHGSPFSKTEASDKTVHLFLLAEQPADPDLAKMDAAKAATEEYVLSGKVLYLHTPSGFGRAKLATLIERALGVHAMARNWRSVTKILDLAEQM